MAGLPKQLSFTFQEDNFEVGGSAMFLEGTCGK